MDRYLCQLCYRIVSCGEEHPCFFYKNDDNVYSLKGPDEFDKVNERVHEAIKNLPVDLNDDFEKSFPEAQQKNPEEYERLSAWLAESNRQVSLRNASKKKRTFNCFAYKTSYNKLRGKTFDTQLSGSLLNFPSHVVHSKENQTVGFWNSSECFKPIYTSQVDIRGSSKRLSRPNKNFCKQKEGLEKDSDSFLVESSGKYRTTKDESDWNVFSNGNTSFSAENSKHICETSNFPNCVFLPPGVEETNDFATGESKDVTNIPLLSEVASKVCNGSRIFIADVQKSLNSMEQTNATAGPSAISGNLRRETSKRKFICDLCDKEFDFKSQLKYHCQKHTDERPFVFHLCRKGFAHKYSLVKHCKLHTGERPFECHIRKRSFQIKYYLVAHYRTHKNEKPENCRV